jgi:hypothetical protein
MGRKSSARIAFRHSGGAVSANFMTVSSIQSQRFLAKGEKPPQAGLQNGNESDMKRVNNI